MPNIQPVSAQNHLLASLPDEDRERLLAHCESIDLVFSDLLYRTGERMTQIYFPTGGFVSLVTPIDGSVGVEVGMVGSEGMLGITLILGIDLAPFDAVVQGAGPALRMEARAFLGELERSPALYRELKRYLYVSIKQLAQTAGCTRFHVVEARLARWLLMTQDRAHSDTFHITQAFLAYMLGVRRVGITNAANSLQKQRLIHYQRGDITILDRAGLEAVACGCYRAELETYERILG